MKKIVYSLLLFLPLLVNGQNKFAPVGAEWYYGVKEFFSPALSYEHFQVLKDTIINEIECREIRVDKFNTTNELFESFNFFLHDRNDSVFYYYNGDFHLLYDFNLEIGDTLEVLVPRDYVELGDLDDSIARQIVTDIDTVTVQDSELRRFHFEPFTDYSFTVFAETIGDYGYFFPINWTLIIIDSDEPYFRCYSDENLNYQVQKCDSTNTGISGTESIENKLSENIFFKDSQILIKFDNQLRNEFEIRINDLYGRLFKKLNQKQSNEIVIDTSDLPRGIYLLSVKANSYLTTRKIIIP